MTGSTQVEELGDIETPILLTSTTSVPRVADALISYMLALPGNEDVLSINPLVGETNDGYLSDIRGRHITPEDVFSAIKNAKPGPVEEGAVGAGTGTVAFGWKGGIGTSSRRLPRTSADTRLELSCRRTMAACSRSPGLRSGGSLGSAICARKLSRQTENGRAANGQTPRKIGRVRVPTQETAR